MGRHWTTEQRREGLSALVRFGNAKRAAEASGIPRSTLQRWAEQPEHGDELTELRREHAREVRDHRTALAAEAWSVVDDGMRLCRAVIADEAAATRDRLRAAATAGRLAVDLDRVTRLDANEATARLALEGAEPASGERSDAELLSAARGELQALGIPEECWPEPFRSPLVDGRTT